MVTMGLECCLGAECKQFNNVKKACENNHVYVQELLDTQTWDQFFC